METEMTTGATQLAHALDHLLCNVVVFYFTTHRAHWNVAGPDFAEYHELFGNIYDDVYGSVDDLAENIRKLGAFPPSLSYMVGEASFEDDSMTTEAKDLALDIYKKNVVMIAMLKGTFDVAEAANEQGIANTIAERIDMHQKWQWQLGASLQTAGMEIPSESSMGKMKEGMGSQMDSAEEATTEVNDELKTEKLIIEDAAEHKELGKKLDVSTIEDAMDTPEEYYTSVERRVASKYKELRNHDINKAENYLVQQVRSGFISGKFNPLDVKV